MTALLSLPGASRWMRRLARAALTLPVLLAACGGGGDGPRVLAQPQTITAAAVPALAVDGQATVSASASSGLAVRWASLTPSLCSVDAGSGRVQALAAGRCQLTADQGGNADWAVAPQLLLTLDISALAQSLSFEALPALVVDQQAMLQARSSAGLTPLVYASLSPDLCQLDAASGLLQARARGDCRVLVRQAGDARHAAAEATATLAIAGLAQRLGLTLPDRLAVGDSVPAQAASSSGLATTLTSLTPQVCDLDNGQLRALAAGECRTAARQAGDERWAAADELQVSLQVQRRSQSLSLDSAPTTLSIGDSALLQASASSGLAPGFASLTPSVCRVDASSGRLQALAAGSCRLQIEQAGDARWAAAAALQQEWTVQRRTQSLVYETSPALTVGSSALVRARASSGLAPAYASLSASVCSVDAVSGQVLPLQSGSCRLVATQDGDADWLPALSQSITLQVSAASQALSFAPPPALTLQRQATVSATASSGLAVRYSSLTPATCSVDAQSGVVQGLAVGDCRIAADQAGDARWATALQQVQTLFVDFVPQAITFGTAPSPSVGRTVAVTASASSGLAVRYSSLTPATCSVDAHSGLVSGLAVGNCLIAADQDGDSRHAAAPQVQQRLSVGPSPSQTIQLSSPVATLTVDGRSTLQAVASSGLAVRFASLTPGVCSVDASSGQVLALAIGRCTIAADQPGDATWEAAAQTTLSLVVHGQAQTLAFAAAPSLVVTRSTLASASASSGLAVRYASLTPTVCSVVPGSGLLTGLAVGHCRISADQDGDGRWAAALTATLELFVDFLSQSIGFGPAPSLSANGSASISASASSGLALRFSSLTPDVCSVQASSGIVSGLIAGTCRIAADQAGDAVHAAAPQAVLAVAVQHATQSIAAGANPSLQVSGSASLVASASSGLGLRYSSLTPAVCSVAADSGVLTGLAAGSCTVLAEQAGDGVWAAAAPVSWTFTVARRSQSLAFAAAPALQAGTVATVRATASSGLAPSYSSLTPAVCSVGSSSGLVQGLNAGSCSIAANQAGNSTWAAAPQATLSLAVAINPVQTLSFAAAPTLSLGGTATVRATASSGLAPVYSSLSPGVCSVGATSGLVTALGVGDCIVAADQPGDASHNPAAQVQLTLSVQTSGLALPGAPSGVSATLGANVRTVLVSVGTASGGGLPITRYTVSSSPAGITASGNGPTVSVSCPVSCAGLAFAVSAGNALGDGPASAAVPVLTDFNVLTTFFEPDTQPRNSVFTGRFTLNSTSGEVSGLQGQLTESMSGNAIGSPPYYDMTQVTLSHQLHSERDATLGGRLVATFAKNTLSTFTTLAGGDGWSPASGIANGGIYAGFPAAYSASIKNSHVLIFVPDDPFAPLSAAQLARLAYADCAPGGMMGAVCMTATSVAGHGSVGTMSGYPLSQTLSRR